MEGSRFQHGLSSFGVPIFGDGTRDISGSTYFVDGNSGLDSNDGSSWERAYQTVAKALSISHADIARGSDRWARRNTIFIAGDWLVEDLILGAQKTDVIGMGSADGYKGGGITGNHVIANTPATGMRWINLNFRPTAAADLFTNTNLSSYEYHGCNFLSAGPTNTAVSAIDSIGSLRLRVLDCGIHGKFSGAMIDFGAGAVDDTVVARNWLIGGDTNGIQVTDTTTSSLGHLGLIHGNTIYCDNVTIDDNGQSDFIITNNWCITPAAYGAGSHVIAVEFAADNFVTANGASYRIPIVTDIEV